MIRIYIAGAISGNPNYKQDFDAAKKLLRKEGVQVISPCDYIPSSWSWKKAMREDIKLLMDCDFIYFCNDITNSRGAIIEKNLAKTCGIKEYKI